MRFLKIFVNVIRRERNILRRKKFYLRKKKCAHFSLSYNNDVLSSRIVNFKRAMEIVRIYVMFRNTIRDLDT